jgi:hypothetical protein
MDGAAFEIHVEEVTPQTNLEVDGIDIGQKGLNLTAIREAVRACQHGPNAVAGVVSKKEGPVIGAGIVSALIEGHSRYRRTSAGATFSRNNFGGVAIGVVRRGMCATIHVEVLTD